MVSFNPGADAPSELTTSRLQTIVELRLRQAGFRVLSVEEDKRDTDIVPYVHLSIWLLKIATKGGTATGYAYFISLSANRVTLLPTTGAVVPAELWQAGVLGVGDLESSAANVERIVGTQLDDFLNDWLAANPK